MLEARMVDSLAGLEPHLEDWDALAEASGRPYCAPAWMLAWWQHLAPDSDLRVVLVHEDGALVAVAPFCASRWRGLTVHRLLCSGTSTRIGPLPAAGVPEPVAQAIATALAETAPHVVRLEGIEATSPWPRLLARGWPGGRVRLRSDFELDAPIVFADDGYDAWFATRSKNFRKDAKRVRRRLDERGATLRMSTVAELEADLPELFRLHHARWSLRGGSGNLDPRVEAMLREAAAELVPRGRMRLFVLEADGVAISADLAVDAGAWSGVWGGGFDPAWSKFGPGMVTQNALIEDGAARGIVRVDFGEGEEAYKRVIGEEGHPVRWMTLFPPARRRPIALLRMAPNHVRNRLRARVRALPPEQRDRVRRARRSVLGRVPR